jgi:hypothetical protein
MTDWNYRTLLQPPLRVYTKEEVESIWFSEPKESAGERTRFRPHTSGYEGGGSFSFQSWETSDTSRHFLLKASVLGGISISRALGFEIDADFGWPVGGGSDEKWKSYTFGSQVTMNVVAHPIVWQGAIPFLLVGGGASTGIPIGGTLLDPSGRGHSLVDFGLGLKWGWDGLGYRIEWRHSYYSWSQSAGDYPEAPTVKRHGDSSEIRFGMFLYH